MVITVLWDLLKTVENSRVTVSTERLSWESGKYSEDPVSLPPGDTLDFECTQGIIIVSGTSFDIVKEVPYTCPTDGAVMVEDEITVDKLFIAFTPMNISITNPEDAEADLELVVFTFDE